MHHWKSSGILSVVACAVLLAGCSGVAPGSDGAELEDGTLQVTSQALSAPFLPPRGLTVAQFTSFGPKIARSPTWSNYAWDNNGVYRTKTPSVSRGGTGNGAPERIRYFLGTQENYQASLPSPRTFDEIVGIGIAQNTAHVYTWWETGKVTEGTSDQLARYATNTWQGVHNLSNLVDADVSPNGLNYYYWEVNNNIFEISRSVGTSVRDGEATSVVTVPGKILFSISFQPGGAIEAWYTDGTVVVSGNSLFLDGSH